MSVASGHHVKVIVRPLLGVSGSRLPEVKSHRQVSTTSVHVLSAVVSPVVILSHVQEHGLLSPHTVKQCSQFERLALALTAQAVLLR